MGLGKVGLYSAFSTAARLLSGLLVVKLVAAFAGPEGVAKMGQFLSLMSLLVVFAGGGLGTGLVKYVAEYRSDETKLTRLLGAGFFYTLVTSFLMGVGVLLFSKPLAVWLLGDVQYQSLIWVLAVAQSSIAVHNYIVAIINGFMDVRRVAVIHICGSVLSLAFTAVLAYLFQLYGALLALVLGQTCLIIVSIWFFRRSRYFNRHFFIPVFDRKKIELLAKFSVMTLTATLLMPLVHIWTRNYLAAKFSWTAAGYWQAVSKVSEAYLLFITMAISVYYLPKLSMTTDKEQFKFELRTAYKYILPLVSLLALCIYMLRGWVTLILFSSDFSKANSLYAPQLIGDVIKIASYIFSYIMLAKSMTKIYFISEIIFSLMYIGWILILTNYFGLVGAMYAFVVNYTIYLIFTFEIAKRYIRKM